MIGLLVLGACTVVPDGPSGNPYLARAALEAEPASRLAMPGADVIRRGGSERFDNITGPEPSFVGAVYGAQSTTDDVFRFYERELGSLGWKRDPHPGLVSGEITSWAWCKTGIVFRLAIFDPDRYDRRGIEGGERFKTVFDVRLVAARRSCPYVPPPMPTP